MAGAEAFDAVVVGAGAAGCAVAGRLSENLSRSVLLLEAGPDPRPDLPEILTNGWRITREFDWGYTSEADSRGVVEMLRRGKILGGTAWYTRYALRGSAAGYDEWESMGIRGWNFDAALPYLNRLETDLDFGDRPGHGTSGPIPITRYPDLDASPIGAATLRAYEVCGFPPVEDHNRPGAIGAGRMPMNSRGGARVTTAQGYLPARGERRKFTVQADAEVTAVTFEGSRATGVRLTDGTYIRAGQVVLSAGTYGSACILMRSGVGPAAHLRAVDVPQLVDLPGVGGNLISDVAVDVDCGYQGEPRAEPHFRYIATFHSRAARSDAAPDLMFWPPDPYGDPAAYTIDVLLLKPHSRGVVRLRSADPGDPPRVELRCLDEPSDVQRLAEGLERAQEVAAQPEIRRLCANPPTPATGDRKKLLALVRQNAYSLPHVLGTCVMGPSPDDGAVVDGSGRVYGTEGLFVVDGSILPGAPSGFTHIPTIMVAERLAERIAASR